MFIIKGSYIVTRLLPVQTFFGVPVDLGEAVVKRVEAIQADAIAVSEYLEQVSAAMATRAELNLSLIGLPSCLDEPVVPEVVSESKPAKKATAATSRKKSPPSSKKTEPKASATKPPKAE